MLNRRVSRGLTLTVGVAIAFFATCGLADGPYDRDIYVEPLLPTPPFRWTGLYVGGNLGGAWPTVTLRDNLTGNSFSGDQSGFIGGTQIGYNFQLDNLVLGIEWDFDWSNINATRNGFVGSGIGTIRASTDMPWITTLAGRVGLTLDHTLIYLKIGGGWVRNDAVITNLTSNARVSASNTNGGGLIGAGAEYAFPFLPHWSAKLEYEFLDLADQTGLALIRSGTFNFSRDVQLLKFGISYKFN